MKWLITPLLWLLAAVIALRVAWRIYLGKPVLLRGWWTPRVLRIAAVLLVFFGHGAEKTDAAPVPLETKKVGPNDELPPTITGDVAMTWHTLQQQTSEWTRYKRLMTAFQQRSDPLTPAHLEDMTKFERFLPASLYQLTTAEMRASVEGKPFAVSSPRDLLTVLDEAEAKGFIDPWLAAFVWRKTETLSGKKDRKPFLDLMARLHRHARLANALILCRFQVRPILEAPTAWRGKAARPPQWQQQQALEILQNHIENDKRTKADFLACLKTNYPKADAGTWQKDALTLLSVEKGSAAVTPIHTGQTGMPQTEGGLRLGRLDLLETTPGDRTALLLHSVLGRIEIPAGKLVSVWDLPKYLSEKSHDTLKKTVQVALTGDDRAARQIEQMLPFAQPFLREALKANPQAAGAPALRMILTEFDDVPMSPPQVGAR